MNKNTTIIGDIRIETSTEGVFQSYDSPGLRKDICKTFGKIECTYGQWSTAYCFLIQENNILEVRTQAGNQFEYNTEQITKDALEGEIFGFFHKSYYESIWYLESILDENFYKNLDIQECFGKNENINTETSKQEVVQPNQESQIYFVGVIGIIIGLLVLGVIFFKKFFKKSPK